MANPQLEDGHTQIANEILGALMRIYLPPNQWQVLLCIIRKTYGFKKKVDWIANFQIVEATGLGKTIVSRALKALESRHMIIRNGKTLGFQKNWELWAVSSPANPIAKVSNPANNEKLAIQSTELAIQSTELAIQSTKVSSPRVTQKKKETITKETIQKKEYGEFHNVFLTVEEHQWLKERLQGKVGEYIDRLSGYLESTGKDKYKSHYATILNWYRRDENNGRHKQGIGKLPSEAEITDSIRRHGQ